MGTIGRGREAPAVARTRAPSATGDAGEIDMTGVDPLRFDEVRRRVGVVRSYLALEAPADKERRAHAKRLSLSVNQFLALVRAWREYGNGAAMSGAGASRGVPRPNGIRNLPAESIEAAKAVLATLGPSTPHVDAVAAVTARCSALGIRAPSRSTIWNLAMAVRRDAATACHADGIVISQCHLKLPIQSDHNVIFPSVVLAVDAGDGRVVAAAMGDDADISSTLAAALAGSDEPLRIDKDLARGIPLGNSPTPQCLKPTAARTATAKAVGRGIGSIDLIYQISRAAPPKQMLRSRKDRPISMADAQRVFGEQAAIHNSARSAGPPVVSWIREVRRTPLKAASNQLAGRPLRV